MSAVKEKKFLPGERVSFTREAAFRSSKRMFQLHARVGTVVRERNHFVYLIWDGNRWPSAYHIDFIRRLSE